MALFGSSLFPFYACKARDRASVRGARSLVAIVVLSGLAWLVASITYVTDQGSPFDSETLIVFFFQTSFGKVWILRLALLLCIAIVGLSRMERNFRTFLVMLLSGLLVSQALLGHAAMGRGWRGLLMSTAYSMHVLAAALWFGGLVPLARLLLRMPRDAGGEERHRSFESFSRFSAVAFAAMLVIIATGIANTVLHVHLPSELVLSDYGRVITLKAALLACVLLLACVNRFILMPRLSIEQRARSARSALVRTIAAEFLFGVVILGAAALLGTLPPPD
jgi:putative copper resistance protein D